MIAAVSPSILMIAGFAALAAWILAMRSSGARNRVARLLATTPRVSIGEARLLAGGGPRYVRVQGRVDSETDFEDDAHRPLVFRRTRLQFQQGSAWMDVDDRRERVPFEVREGLDAIAIDDAALDDGLVVVVRESVGTAADVPENVPAGIDPLTPVRLRIEQVSRVEHAIVIGVPALDADGAPRISAGLGRPLILATMDQPDAMRLLAEGDRQRPILLAATLVTGLVLLSLAVGWTLVEALS
jgi:hypothetical protein